MKREKNFKNRRAIASARKDYRKRAKNLREYLKMSGCYPTEKGARWLGGDKKNRKETKHEIMLQLEGMEAADLAAVFFVTLTLFHASRRQTV